MEEPRKIERVEPEARVLLLGGASGLIGAAPFGEDVQAFIGAHDMRVCALVGEARACTPASFERLRAGGVDLFALAGLQGAGSDAAGVVKSAGEAPIVGAGETNALRDRPVLCTINGVRLGFLSVGERLRGEGGEGGFADALDIRLFERVRGLLCACDHVIVYLSAGLDALSLPLPEWRARALALIKAGASIVAGVSPYGAYGWQQVEDGTALYSLGRIDAGECLLFSLTLRRNGRCSVETRAASRGGNALSFGASEGFKACINAQNELFLNERAYALAADAACRTYAEQNAAALFAGASKAGKRTLKDVLSKEPPRVLNADAAYALLTNESRLLALTRGLRQTPLSEGDIRV